MDETETKLEDFHMEVEAALALAVGLKAIGAGLAMLGAIGAGAGIGILVGGAVQGIARNPDAGHASQSGAHP